MQVEWSDITLMDYCFHQMPKDLLFIVEFFGTLTTSMQIKKSTCFNPVRN